jgi:hypothetical protein
MGNNIPSLGNSAGERISIDSDKQIQQLQLQQVNSENGIAGDPYGGGTPPSQQPQLPQPQPPLIIQDVPPKIQRDNKLEPSDTESDDKGKIADKETEQETDQEKETEQEIDDNSVAPEDKELHIIEQWYERIRRGPEAFKQEQIIMTKSANKDKDKGNDDSSEKKKTTASEKGKSKKGKSKKGKSKIVKAKPPSKTSSKKSGSKKKSGDSKK